MSFDLAILPASGPMGADAAAEIYRRLSDGAEWRDLIGADENIARFLVEVCKRWPQLADLSEDEVDESPWSADFDVSPAHAIVSISWPRVEEVAPVVIESALGAGLNVYDPQEEVLHTPRVAARTVSSSKLPPQQLCAECGKPIDASEDTLEDPDGSVWHVECGLDALERRLEDDDG